MKIFVKTKPSAKRARVEKIDDTHFTIAVKEPPTDGRANWAVTRMLAAYFNIAPSRVHLISGASGRQKIFEIV